MTGVQLYICLILTVDFVQGDQDNEGDSGSTVYLSYLSCRFCSSLTVTAFSQG